MGCGPSLSGRRLAAKTTVVSRAAAANGRNPRQRFCVSEPLSLPSHLRPLPPIATASHFGSPFVGVVCYHLSPRGWSPRPAPGAPAVLPAGGRGAGAPAPRRSRQHDAGQEGGLEALVQDEERIRTFVRGRGAVDIDPAGDPCIQHWNADGLSSIDESHVADQRAVEDRFDPRALVAALLGVRRTRTRSDGLSVTVEFFGLPTSRAIAHRRVSLVFHPRRVSSSLRYRCTQLSMNW
jgi:hypothetical protein